MFMLFNDAVLTVVIVMRRMRRNMIMNGRCMLADFKVVSWNSYEEEQKNRIVK
jgi:hypothetical protein